MIPIGPGDVAKIIEAAGTIVQFIERAKNPNRLADFAKLMAQPDSDDRATAIRQFLQDLIQERGFTPWYGYQEDIDVPKDLLCDLVDLLVSGATIESKAGWLGSLMGGGDQVQADRLRWATVITGGLHDQIIAALETLMARAGRVRSYKGSVTIGVDLDWLADSGMALIG